MNRFSLFDCLGGVTKVAKLLGVSHCIVSKWQSNNDINIPYQYAVVLAYVSGIPIDEIAPHAIFANKCLKIKDVESFPLEIKNKVTPSEYCYLGEKIIILKESNKLISGQKRFLDCLKNNKTENIIYISLFDVVFGDTDLDVFNLSQIEKMLIALEFNEIYKKKYKKDCAGENFFKSWLEHFLKDYFDEKAIKRVLTAGSKKVFQAVNDYSTVISDACAVVNGAVSNFKNDDCTRRSLKDWQELILDTFRFEFSGQGFYRNMNFFREHSKPQATIDYKLQPKKRLVKIVKFLTFEDIHSARNHAVTQVKDLSTQETFNVYEGQLVYCESGDAYLCN